MPEPAHIRVGLVRNGMVRRKNCRASTWINVERSVSANFHTSVGIVHLVSELCETVEVSEGSSDNVSKLTLDPFMISFNECAAVSMRSHAAYQRTISCR
jgi:hypothetical protein